MRVRYHRGPAMRGWDGTDATAARGPGRSWRVRVSIRRAYGRELGSVRHPLPSGSVAGVAVVASIPMWLVLGWLASRRATRSTVASWRDYWREMTFLTIAVVLGAIVALAAATSILGESLLD